jgi:excisionase family DNA binding protein
MNAMTSTRLLDVQQAAKRLRVSEYTIRRRLRDGSLRGFRIAPNGGIRIDERSVDALLVPYERPSA